MTVAIELMVYHRRLLQSQVVDDVTTQSLGRLTAVWINLDHHTVLGFECRAGLWDFKPHTYSLEQIHRLDDQQVTVDLAETAHPTLMWKLKASNSMVVGDRFELEVWTQRGKWLGNVVDFSFDLESGSICNYLCSQTSAHASTKPEFRIATDTIVDAGVGWLLVSDPVTQSIEQEIEERWFSNPLLSAL